MCFLSFFFFKQKTAYEMRISDWSSDVCSSDLARIEAQFGPELVARHHGQAVVAILAVVPEAEVAVIVDLAETQALGQPQFKQRLDALMQRLVRVERACRNVGIDGVGQKIAPHPCAIRSEERRGGKEGVSK